MADQTHIEWTDATWNIITGCSMVDAGCTNCYAMGLAASRLNSHPSRAGLTRESGGRHVWTGETRFNEAWLDQPLRWKRGRMIFVCAHGDLFHETVPDEWIDRVFAVMALAPQHTFQVLTKRPDRAARYLAGHGLALGVDERAADIGAAAWDIDYSACYDNPNLTPYGDEEDAHTALVTRWPLPNVWLGTSISDQASADARVPHLLTAPAAVRFLSAEPLLGPVDLHRWMGVHHHPDNRTDDPETLAAINKMLIAARQKAREDYGFSGIDWVIVGGESGKNARPMHPDLARSLRDQCQAAGVAFFFKQWGEWLPYSQFADDGDWMYEPLDDPESDASRRCSFASCCLNSDGMRYSMGEPNRTHSIEYGAFSGPSPMSMYRIGKARAGRLLDGREWSQMPGRL